MQISDIFVGLGEDNLRQLLRSVSIGKLKTFQLYDRMKLRLHLNKLNSETLRDATPRLWTRLTEKEEDFATELSQAILISHLDMIQAVLDELKIPHEEGFFSKDLDPAPHLTEGWRERVFQRFQNEFPKPVLLFYINHLNLELTKAGDLFAPAA